MEFPLAQICPQGSHEPLSPTSGTFQPMDLTCRSFQGLSSPPEPRGHTWKAEEAPRSLRAPTAHTEASAQTTAAASILGDAGRPEKVSGEESSPSLQVETRAWFQKTQAPQLLQQGAAPAWFHGFITRREAERLLESQPQGCYLVRFSESAVTFVLTYRSQTCCRHFLLAQLRDGRHVVLGEDSAHARLQDLLSHYTTRPLIPYGETLTQPLARQTPDPAGLSLRSEEPNSGCKSQDPIPQHNPFIKQEQDSALVHKEGSLEPKEPFQPPRPKPPIPAKPQPPHKVYASPKRRPCPALPPKPTNPIYHEPDEPIAFYAMGWGSPGEAPSNIYAEVEGPPETVSIKHPVLRKCQSRPVPGHQNPGDLQLHSENSVSGQSPPLPQQPPVPWRHMLPPILPRQMFQDRGQM